ncbi:hypothetical protein NLJ89_g10108 [Agrocybe chaxingu]|uniref:Ankyrin repeat protein n=1 Tax=Agrocybe chaxingu TaxID=84603 RepID=A0A9W8JYS5_9AGAR|nr:hypothetical protein NLJ89_g10108 [Agrocybe chaxingu]
MDSTHNPLENYDLHHAALIGDADGVKCALSQGANTNALDGAGRTAIMCAVAGEHWQNIDAYDASFMTPDRLKVLKTLVAHPDISLLTLNAPQSSMNGVIPLGMAAWLNQPQAVRTLLEDSAESVSVDGMDSHGATALMYAARDGSLEVVQLLSAERTRLSSDCEHLIELACSSMPFSEDLESPPATIFTQEATARLTNTLISSIHASDSAFLHSLLFSPSISPSSPPALYPMSVPVLVNIPDSNGWSLVHHCVTVPQPSIEILDALYLAGADVSLFTTHEQQTPLHILARSAQSPSVHASSPTTSSASGSSHSLHDFVLHLIHDLRAPLSARDKDDETCIHIAAEHGNSMDLLTLLLDCDTTGTVREMKNSRGLTPMDVAKREFLPVFRHDEQRSPSALSNYTIRPSDSFTSLTSLSDLNSKYMNTSNDTSSIYSAGNIDIGSAIQLLLSNLRVTSPSATHHISQIHQLEACVEETTEQCNTVVAHFRARIEEASRVVEELQKTAERINSVRNVVTIATKGKLMVRGIIPLQSNKRPHRESEDSQLTVVSVMDEGYASGSLPSTPLTAFSVTDSSMPSTRTQTPAESPVCRVYFDNLKDVERQLDQLQERSMLTNTPNESPTKLAARLKQAMKKKKKLEDKIHELELDPSKAEKKEKDTLSGAVKAWIKRIVVPHPTALPRVEPVKEIVLHEQKPNVVPEVVRVESVISSCGDAIDASIDNALRTSQVVLEAAYRDLLSIHECLAAAEQFIDLANHTISRTQRVVKRAVKKREAMLAELQTKFATASLDADGELLSPGLLGYSTAITSRPSLASISTIYSTASSVVSVAATLTEHDDEDTRIIRRLLLRKIEAQTSGAWDEVDKVMGWLQIVKEAVRGVKRRAYL